MLLTTTVEALYLLRTLDFRKSRADWNESVGVYLFRCAPRRALASRFVSLPASLRTVSAPLKMLISSASCRPTSRCNDCVVENQDEVLSSYRETTPTWQDLHSRTSSILRGVFSRRTDYSHLCKRGNERTLRRI